MTIASVAASNCLFLEFEVHLKWIAMCPLNESFVYI